MDQLIPSILDALDELLDDKDKEHKDETMGLIRKIGNRRFLFLLKKLSKILHESDIATKDL